MAAKKKARKSKSKQRVAPKKKRGSTRSRPAAARKAVKRKAPARKAVKRKTPARKAAKRTAPPAQVEGLTVQETGALRDILKTGGD